MLHQPSPIKFDPSLLSPREDEILSLAIEGMTDEQIAQRLQLSTSTVNSYWVRIRGKLGHLSRTELVGSMLRLEACRVIEELETQRERLENERQTLVDRLEKLERRESLRTGDPWHLAALMAAPEAVLVLDGTGRIHFANHAADRLFDQTPGSILGRSVCELVALQQRQRVTACIGEYFAAGLPGRVVLARDYAIFGRRQDGGLFRATVSLDGFETAEGPKAICIVRDFMAEFDCVRRAKLTYADVN